MTFIVKPGRNPIVKAAFAGLRAAERAEKKTKAPAEVGNPISAPTSKTAKPPAKSAAKRRSAKK